MGLDESMLGKKKAKIGRGGKKLKTIEEGRVS
jgi:hypothetical protein